MNSRCSVVHRQRVAPSFEEPAPGPARGRRGIDRAHLLGMILALCLAPSAARANETELLKTDSPTPYVHRLTLYDHEGIAISPGDVEPQPYSPRATCSKCHPYTTISHGWHFNEPDANAPAGRPGEPWLLPNADGTAMPISGRGWPGTRSLADADLSQWDFVKRFGHHTPGGGYGAPAEEAMAESDESFRWPISGQLEIDCMFCHSADQQHDPAEAAAQIERENFRWAPTAALRLAVIRGDAKDVPDDFDPFMPPSPDYPNMSLPEVVYDARRFDADERVWFNITRRVPNERCTFCHASRIVGDDAPAAWEHEQDVHLAAGLLCVDCHRHGIDHATTRGYPGEAHATTQPTKAALTCAGCHLGTADATTVRAALGGRYAAPHPQHRGLPPLHFERMTCTACHSGSWPQMQPRRVQTALAHQLGIASRERSADTSPAIFAPVFGHDQDGRIAPQRAMVAPADGDGHRLHRWSYAHDVRPAAQSLGVNGCGDCHADDSPIVFGGYLGGDADFARLLSPTTGDDVQDMTALRGDNRTLANLWPLGFALRPAFKIYGFVCAAIIAVLLMRAAWDGMGQVVFARSVPTVVDLEPTPTAARLRGLGHLFHALVAIGVITQAATAFGSEVVFGTFGGWALLTHMAGAGLVVTGLTGTALLWARHGQFGIDTGATSGQKWLFWLGLLAGLGVMLTMLAAMLPVFGYVEQHALIELHEKFAIALLALVVIHTLVSLGARRRKLSPE